MAAIFQTTFSNAFSWMKMYNFWVRFHCSFVPKGPIDNIPTLVQIMAWGRPGGKPLSEAMMVSLLTHMCVTWPQWIKKRMNTVIHITMNHAGHTNFHDIQSSWSDNVVVKMLSWHLGYHSTALTQGYHTRSTTRARVLQRATLNECDKVPSKPKLITTAPQWFDKKPVIKVSIQLSSLLLDKYF